MSTTKNSKIKLFHCRFCAAKNQYETLIDFTKNTEMLKMYFKIIDFFKIDFIDLSLENLPRTTCGACCKSFQDAYNFFDKVKKTQQYLKKYYRKRTDRNQSTNTTKNKSENILNSKHSAHTETNVELKNTVLKQSTNTVNKNATIPISYTENRELNNIDNKNAISVIQSPILELPIFYQVNLQNTNNQVKPDEFVNESLNLLQIDTSDIVATYCGVPVFEIDKDAEPNDNFYQNFCDIIFDDNLNADLDPSWTSYKWFCLHCNFQCENMDELRGHSKEHHNACYAYNCIDCTEKFNTFNAFIEHVRMHREVLRNYCQYCNKKFKTKELCMAHVPTHFEGPQRICEQCGEVCSDPDGLERHKKLYKKISLPRKYNKIRPKVILENDEKSWTDYEWACQECFIKLPDVSKLRQHVQNIHNKCFAMRCSDCLRFMRNYRTFVAHVTAHRPYLTTYCQYCNTHFEDETLLKQHIDDHLKGSQRPCHGCGQIFPDNFQMSQHMKKYNSPRCESVLTTEDLTCDICSKISVDIIKFRAHRKIHDEKKCDFTCETCGKAFYKNYMLTDHIKTHSSVKTEICQVCNKGFHLKSKLKAHVATHSDNRPFICNECGNGFKTKVRLKQHLLIHGNNNKFKCKVCSKEFNYKNNLRNHEFQHTGLRPYPCQSCEKTFTNWANCNKHMIRKHGIHLAKSKVTAYGKLEINRKTGEPKKLASDSSAREWLSEMMKPMKRGKKTGIDTKVTQNTQEVMKN